MNSQNATFHIDSEFGVLFIGTKQCGYELSNEGLFAWINGERKVVTFDHFQMPLADIAIVTHGRWIEHSHLEVGGECSVCGWQFQWFENGEAHYCPHCGAKMDLEASDGKA